MGDRAGSGWPRSPSGESELTVDRTRQRGGASLPSIRRAREAAGAYGRMGAVLRTWDRRERPDIQATRVKPDFELPGDPEGGMFGLRRALESGPSQQPSDVHRKLVAALLSRLRSPRVKGRPKSHWRSELRPIVAQVLREFPNATNAELARIFFDDPEGPNLNKTAGITSILTIQNWLTEIRRLNT
jgi:hypothetical protein